MSNGKIAPIGAPSSTSGGSGGNGNFSERLTRIETRIEHLTTREDFSEIKTRIEHLATREDIAEIKTIIAEKENSMLRWLIGIAIAAAGSLIAVLVQALA